MARTATKTRAVAFAVHPVTPDRWKDLASLFGPKGACAGCWCMWPRLSGPDFGRRTGAQNRAALQRIVRSGEPPGLIGYVDGKPAAWCAVAPRERYVRLARSRVMAPVDDRPVWSVICFFTARDHRRSGLTTRMLREAVRYAAAHGARIVEGYPIDPPGRAPDTFVWHGLAAAFRRAGFKEIARRAPTRPVMRRAVRPAGDARGATGRGAARRRKRA